ncbi:MAG: disulfide bond formation protein B [SAR86 cluster bacterium]|nr:disulfide bond formation protein B [SAR86 cluster bacterium]
MQDLLFLNSRRFFALLGAASLGLIIVALFFEHMLLIKPCILCYAQRACVYLLILVSLVGFLHKNQSLLILRTYMSLCIAFIISGMSFSIRQLYLQNLPRDLVPTCGPDIDYLFETLPVLEVFMIAIKGDGNCAEVLWSFLGISIPGWLLLAFVLMFIYAIVSFYISKKLHSKS